MGKKLTTEIKLSLIGVIVAILGVVIAYFQLFSTDIERTTTYGNNSPIIKSNGDVSINK